MIKTITRETESGTMTVYLIKENDCIPLKVILFNGNSEIGSRDGEEPRKILDLAVYAFNTDSLEWKCLLDGADFWTEEVEKHFKEGTIVEFALGMVSDFFGIKVR